ncbi:hypothetical protein D9C73_015450 [Collichthys lucidus]|uniref:Uncharacterized protein n=1 Tax=Collichthys lucidus TaxID=240159 RepID=A0A4U5V4P1_COLLU|nr:hypothetical protein D9C73_015450 [Collichthys lucidus]
MIYHRSTDVCSFAAARMGIPAAPSSFMLAHTELTELQQYRMSSCSIRTQFTLRPADLSELEATNSDHIQLSMISSEMNSTAASVSLMDTDEEEMNPAAQLTKPSTTASARPTRQLGEDRALSSSSL